MGKEGGIGSEGGGREGKRSSRERGMGEGGDVGERGRGVGREGKAGVGWVLWNWCKSPYVLSKATSLHSFLGDESLD